VRISQTQINNKKGKLCKLIKKGKIKDSDGDFIPDVVEDKVDEVKGKVQKKVKAVKTRVKNVKDETTISRCCKKRPWY